jgi:hypothetical protein
MLLRQLNLISVDLTVRQLPLELVHNPIASWEGVIGAQLGQQKLDLTGEEAFMAPTTRVVVYINFLLICTGRKLKMYVFPLFMF